MIRETQCERDVQADHGIGLKSRFRRNILILSESRVSMSISRFFCVVF